MTSCLRYYILRTGGSSKNLKGPKYNRKSFEQGCRNFQNFGGDIGKTWQGVIPTLLYVPMGLLRSFEKEVFAPYHGTKIGVAVVGPPGTPGSVGPAFDWTNDTFVAFMEEIGLALLLIIKTYSSGLIRLFLVTFDPV